MEGGNPYFTPEARAHLDEHGWVRIEGVVGPEVTRAFREGAARYYELWDPALCLDDPAAWNSRRLPPGHIHGIDKLGGHAWFMWEVRQRPEIVRLWTEYFGCPEEELRVSFDGFNVSLAGTPRRRDRSWAHFDHGTAPVPYRCLQSIVVMENCEGDDDGGLVVWDKSHRAHDGYFRLSDTECLANWHLFPFERDERGRDIRTRPQPFTAEIERDGRRYLSPGDPERDAGHPVPMERMRIRARAGDVVCWFSDTAHQNEAPRPGGRDRFAAYVSMASVRHVLPREFATRRRAFDDGATTSHWAAHGFKRNAMPRTYTHEATALFKAQYQRHRAALPAPQLTDVGRRLAGLFDDVPGSRTKCKRKNPPSSFSSSSPPAKARSNVARLQKKLHARPVTKRPKLCK